MSSWKPELPERADAEEACPCRLPDGDQEAWEASISTGTVRQHCWHGLGWVKAVMNVHRAAGWVLGLESKVALDLGPLDFTYADRTSDHLGAWLHWVSSQHPVKWVPSNTRPGCPVILPQALGGAQELRPL